MLWVVLATALSATSALPAAKVASTYDEAACAEAEKIRDDNGEINCSEPEPVPAVLDCNDARVSLWLGEMIGSCDMPKPQIPGVLPVVRAAGGDQRVCRDGHCGIDAFPIRPAARSLDDLTPLLAKKAATPFVATSSAHRPQLMLRVSQSGSDRLERPPRFV